MERKMRNRVICTIAIFIATCVSTIAVSVSALADTEGVLEQSERDAILARTRVSEPLTVQPSHARIEDFGKGSFEALSGDPKAFNVTDYLLGDIGFGTPPTDVHENVTSVTTFGNYTYVAFETANGYVFLFQTSNGFSWSYNYVTAGTGLYNPEVVVDSSGYVYLTMTMIINSNSHGCFIRTTNPNDISSFWTTGVIYFSSYYTKPGYEGAPSLAVGASTETAMTFPSIYSGDTYYSLFTVYSTDTGTSWSGSYFSYGDVSGDYDVYYPSVKFNTSYINITCEVNYSSTDGDVGHVYYTRPGFVYTNYHWYDYANARKPHAMTSGANLLIVFESNYNLTRNAIFDLYSTDQGLNFTGYTAASSASYDYTYARCWIDGTNTRATYMRSDNKAFYIQGVSGTTWSAPVQVSDTGSSIAAHYHTLSAAYNTNQTRKYVVWSDQRNATKDIYFNCDPPAPTATPGTSPTATPTVPPATATPTNTPVAFTNSPTATSSATPTITPTRTPTSTPTATLSPTRTPTTTSPPTGAPTLTPTLTPTRTPTPSPTFTPTNPPFPTNTPTQILTWTPTNTPFVFPTATPTQIPTWTPTDTPFVFPTATPTQVPTWTPTNTPFGFPTPTPTWTPTTEPSGLPTRTPSPSPTASATQTVTRTPTATEPPSPTDIPDTPVPSPTSTPSAIPTEPYETHVELLMPGHYFSPGDECWLKAFVYSGEPVSMERIPFAVILDLELGMYWCYPSWQQYPPLFDYDLITLTPGETEITVIGMFYWPNTGSDAFLTAHFYSALLNREATDLLGEMGMWSFGWGP